MKRSASLRHRVALWFAAAFLLTLVPLFFTLHVALNRILMSDLDANLAGSADVLAGQITTEGSLDSPHAIRQAVAISSLERLVGGSLLAIVRTLDGDVLAASVPLPADALKLADQDLATLRDGNDLTRTVSAPGGRDLRVHAQPIVIDGDPVAIVETAAALDPVTGAVSHLQTLLLGEAIVAVVAATAIGFFVAGRSLRPLEEVAAIAADIEAHDLTRRLHLQGAPDEIARLAETFDAMLDRLERAFALQRSFALDVAHELRTPLTALRGNLDVLLLDPNLTPELRDEVERLSAETARLTRLTSNLLSLAQAEAGRTAEHTPVELDLLALEVYRQARSLRTDVRVRLGHEDQALVIGDADLLKQLLLNLVENAVKYSPAGGVVTLALNRDGCWAWISVTDEGPGIAPEHLPHIFDRFYRAPTGGGRVAGGAGIGLAVAKWIAEQHAGTITVETPPNSGSTFIVAIPLAAE